jgi:hypothetical protein
VHWASGEAVATLQRAIADSAVDVPLAWILSARTAALPSLNMLVELADARVELPPLGPEDRAELLARRLGELPEKVRRHVVCEAGRGNPLFLEHLADAITEGSAEDALPATLHEVVLVRLDGLLKRARLVTHWSNRRFDACGELEALEQELGDWLDRLEASDVADLATIGRYLARLRAVDVELVVARSVLRMPVAANRRLLWAIERLAAASTAALLDYLEAVAREGKEVQAAREACAAADKAERTLHLADAERLLELASRHDSRPELVRKLGDLALALGRPDDALHAYSAVMTSGDGGDELSRRTARAEAVLGDVERAASRLGALMHRPGADQQSAYAAGLDLARLRGLAPPAASGHHPIAIVRRIARTEAWAHAAEPEAARQAIRRLVLDGEPASCAAELIETAALSRFAGLAVGGLDADAAAAAQKLNNPPALRLLNTSDVVEARRTFVHWDA